MARKPNETVQLKLRFLESLRRQLERAAKDSGHSMNTEIVNRIEQSFRKDEALVQSRAVATQAARDAVVEFLARTQGVSGHNEGATTISRITDSKKD
jgi:Arc-like DNA binding dprotein